jgi:hypothetical protein
MPTLLKKQSTARQCMALTLCVVSTGLLLSYSAARYLLESPPQTYAMALADLDGDGDLDAFLVNGKNEGQASNTVWLNDGAGHFRDSGQRLGLAEHRTLALGDLDGDGDPDALVGTTGWVVVFLNQGGAQGGRAGTFKDSGRVPDTVTFWGGIHPLALGDLDGDGDLDAFIGQCCGGLMMVDGKTPVPLLPYNSAWLNESASGSGRFPLRDSGQRLEPGGSVGIALGDLDSDGDLDAFVANSRIDLEAGPVPLCNQVWLNDGAGRFHDSGQRLSQADSRAVALGDLDGDGDLDAFIGTNGPAMVWLNDGKGQHTDSGQRLGSGLTRAVYLQDLDGNHDLDAFVDRGTSGEIWLNGGASMMTDSRQRLYYSNQHAIALGDIDGDGDADVVAGSLDKEILVWVNDGRGRLTRR